jgi:hypothetical protein
MKISVIRGIAGLFEAEFRINYFSGNGLSSSPEHNMRRPMRLEALPVQDRKQNNENVNNKRKNGNTRPSELNTMDII